MVAADSFIMSPCQADHAAVHQPPPASPPLLLLEIVIAHAQIGLARRHQALKLLGQFSAASPGPRLTGRGEGGAD